MLLLCPQCQFRLKPFVLRLHLYSFNRRPELYLGRDARLHLELYFSLITALLCYIGSMVAAFAPLLHRSVPAGLESIGGTAWNRILVAYAICRSLYGDPTVHSS